MPQVIPAALALAGASTAVVAIASIVLTVGMMVYGKAQQRKAARRQREAYNAALQDRTVTRIATESPYVYVFGRARVGSSIVAMLTSGDRDQYQHLVCVHAAHECDAIEEVYVNGKPLGALDANGSPVSGDFTKTTTGHATEHRTGGTFEIEHTPSATPRIYRLGSFQGAEDGYEEISISYSIAGRTVTTDSIYDGRSVTVQYQYADVTSSVRVKKHLGMPNEPADASLIAEVPSKWTSAHVLRGFCYTVVRVDLNEPEFQGGPPTVEVLMRGARLYDPRTETTAWSQNPALAVNHYLTSEMCGVDADDIPLASVIAAANVCDEVLSSGDARYTINGTVTADEAQSGVLEKMAQAMGGGIVSTTWDMWAGKYVAPVMALEQSDIVGKLAITPGISDADIYNGVRGQFVDAENAYVATDFKPYQNSTYVTADGKEKWTNIDFPFTDSLQRVHNLSRIYTEDQRNGYTVVADFSLKAWKLRIGDRVTLSSPFFGWDAKVFRVTDKKFSPTSPVELALKEDAESIWDEADAVVVDATPNTNLPSPFAIDPLESITCTSGTDALLRMQDGTILSRILVTWPQATSQAVFNSGVIEIEWLRSDSDVWLKTSVTGSETQVFLSDVEDLRTYTVRARTVNSYLNVKSDWIYTEYQVIGKTEPPPDITDLSISGGLLSWTPAAALDLKGYVFRFHYGNNQDWGSAAPLHEGVIVSSPFDLVTRPGGLVTIMGKAIDTSGNYSTSAGVIIMNLGEPPIANVVEEFDFHADGFPGALENCTIVAGDLVADETDSAYGTDDQSFYGPDNDPAYSLSSYARMVYTTGDVPILSALAGSVMTLAHDTEGTDLVIEYRLAGPGSVYGTESDSAYGPDDDSFYGAPGVWIPWPGQIVATNDVYQFRVTIGAGPTRGRISALSLIIDAPDIVEYLEDVVVDAAGTIVPFTKDFTVIKTVTATLQANASGAETIEVDKTNNLAPVLKAYDALHTAVSGATADIIVKGY